MPVLDNRMYQIDPYNVGFSLRFDESFDNEIEYQN